MMESESKLRAFFRNVTDRLNPGSYFIGTTVDSDELVRRVRASTEKNMYQNDFMTVVLPSDNFSKSESPYGLKYYFYLKEAIGRESHEFGEEKPMLVDEYLVVWPELIRVAKDYGLELVMKKNFGQYYDDNCGEHPVSLQGKPEPQPQPYGAPKNHTECPPAN